MTLTPYKNLAFALALAAMTSPLVAQRGAPPEAQSSLLTPKQRKDFLRQPGGLMKISSIVGDIELNDTDERWGQSTLPTMTLASDLIVTAHIERAQSFLTDDGDDVRTNYTLIVDHPITTDAPKEILLAVAGGRIQLSNGHYVTSHTSVWDSLNPNSTYIFFLKKEFGEYHLVTGIQGVFEVAKNSSTVRQVDSSALRSTALQTLDGAQLDIVEDKIRKERANPSISSPR